MGEEFETNPAEEFLYKSCGRDRNKSRRQRVEEEPRTLGDLEAPDRGRLATPRP